MDSAAADSLMSAFPESGRSDGRNQGILKVRFRPQADQNHVLQAVLQTFHILYEIRIRDLSTAILPIHLIVGITQQLIDAIL